MDAVPRDHTTPVEYNSSDGRAGYSRRRSEGVGDEAGPNRVLSDGGQLTGVVKVVSGKRKSKNEWMSCERSGCLELRPYVASQPCVWLEQKDVFDTRVAQRVGSHHSPWAVFVGPVVLQHGVGHTASASASAWMGHNSCLLAPGGGSVSFAFSLDF